MDVKAPFISVVVPTRNREELLTQSALPTVLRQTFEDFEVVVCDNASTDDTRERVEALGDGRIRYFRSEEWIPKEDFFQWSLEHARGEYSMLFFDDDALCQRALEKAHAVLTEQPVDVMTYSRALVYHFPNWHDPNYQNVLTIPPFTKRALMIDARQHLERVYQCMDIQLETPMVTNALYRTRYLTDLARRYGRLFPHGHMGDYNIACIALHHTREFVYLDDPIAVFGHWKENTSAQLHDLKTTMPEYQEWIDWISAEHLPKMPWTQYLWPNCVAAALEDMDRILGLDLKVNPKTYWCEMFRELKRISTTGADIGVMVNRLEKVYRTQTTPAQRKKIMSAVKEGFPSSKEMSCHALLSYQDQNQEYPNEASVLGMLGLRKIGEHNGFQNVLEATEYFERISGESKLLSNRKKLEGKSMFTASPEVSMAFTSTSQPLLGEGQYPRLIQDGAEDDWRRLAAMALIGQPEEALRKLPKVSDPEARFYLGVAHWMARQDDKALVVLRDIPTDHARNLAALIAKPQLRVLAQTDWFDEDFTDSKFDVHLAGLRRKEMGSRGFGVPVAETPHEAANNITDLAMEVVPDFFFAHMLEWELLPRDLPELECPKIGVTSDLDCHTQEVQPWLPVFDEVITVGAEEYDKARVLDPEGSVSIFPKMFGLRKSLLVPFQDEQRPNSLFLSGSLQGPLHEDKAETLRQLLDSPVESIRCVDGFLDPEDYLREYSNAKSGFTFVRHPGTMPSRGLEALAMGCGVATQEGSALTLYFGEDDGVLTYDVARGNLPNRIQQLADEWNAARARRVAEKVREEFAMPRCVSQFLRYLTFLAAKPRVRRAKPARRHLLTQKRHFATCGHRHTPETANRLLVHNWHHGQKDYFRTKDPRCLLNMGRELDLFLATEMTWRQRFSTEDWSQKFDVMLRQAGNLYEVGSQKHPRRLVLRFNALRHAFHLGRPAQVPQAIRSAEMLLKQPVEKWEIDPLDDVLPWDYQSTFFNFRQYVDTIHAWRANGLSRKKELANLIRASLHYYLGHYTGKVDHFQEAVALDGKSPYYRYYLALGLLGRDTAGDLSAAVDLLEALARDSILFEPPYNLLATLYEQGRTASGVVDELENRLRRLKNFRTLAYGSGEEFTEVDLILPPDKEALPTLNWARHLARPVAEPSLLSAHTVGTKRASGTGQGSWQFGYFSKQISAQPGSSRQRVLMIPFELSTWKNARAWSYTGNFAFEEGLQANNVDYFILPALAEVPSNHPGSWLAHAQKLCQGQTFDQVWIWITHNHYSPEFFAWLKTLAPVRVGMVMESMEHTPQELGEMAKVGERKQKVLTELQHMTHVVTYDDADASMFEQKLKKPSLWCPIFVPWRSIATHIHLPSPGPGVFYGTLYNAERQAWAESPELKDCLVRPELPESNSPWISRFEFLQRDCLDSLSNKNKVINVALLNCYITNLRQLRRDLFDLWMEGLRRGYATVNLPSIFKSYAGRVVESMAAGRPVITWEPEHKATRHLFESGQEILWYDRENPGTLRDQIENLQQNPALALEIANNARNKVLKYHTAEIRVRQILDWIESGTQPDYGLTDKIRPVQAPPASALATANAKAKQSQPETVTPEVLKAKAFEYFQQGQLDEAKMAYQQLVDLMPRESGLWVELATVCLQSKDSGGFEKALSQALQLEPANFEARRLLAHANFMGQRYADASVLYAGLVKEKPKDLELTLAFGASNFHTHSYRDAAGAFEHALEIDPGNPVAQENLKAVQEALAETTA